MMINPNEAFEVELFYQYLKDEESVSPSWRKYFEEHRDRFEKGSNEPTVEKKGVKESKEASIPVKKQAIKEVQVHVRSDEELEEMPTIPAKIAANMETSLTIPTATSVRTIPVKALDENRKVINKYLIQNKRKKISFTHILAWAIVRAMVKFPQMNDAYMSKDGKSYRVKKKHINIGLAVDITKKDGSRLLLVPNIKKAESLNFREFIDKYDELIDKARHNRINIDDLEGTTVSLTNPGMIGTTHSNPRLMVGQGTIIATGAIDYPVEFQAVKPEFMTSMAISKVVTITNTYDHRIIQGAESAEYLAYIHKLLIGDRQFYDQIFAALQIPFEPVRWEIDYDKKKQHSSDPEKEKIEKGAHVMQLINAYRVRGHLLASINPLGLQSYYYPELDPAYYGFTIWDLDREFHADDSWDNNNKSLRDIIELLRDSYCGAIGLEFMHISNPQEKTWLKESVEVQKNRLQIPNDEKLHAYKKILQAEEFENFLHTRFLGHKRFSLEGGESLIVLVDKIFEKAADNNPEHIVLGMSHRGRLNVLVNNIGKEKAKIFNEFDDDVDISTYHGAGDVKYHLGDKGKFVSRAGNEIPVVISSNPSHLELVDPVIEGMARAIDNQLNDDEHKAALPILIHGDAAFAGQGLVAETLNLSKLKGYRTGGTIHIVVNNQIGFTTNAESARSSVYATDIGKTIMAPIIHVNGNDPEAVIRAADLAFEYREKFSGDVIIDMICYRKYGHNEADEPSYTQPLLYKKINKMKPISSIFSKQLMKEQVLDENKIEELKKEVEKDLDDAFNKRKAKEYAQKIAYRMIDGTALRPYFTAIQKDDILQITKALTSYPDDFNANPKVQNLLKKRDKMVNGQNPAIDWAMAEALAFGSILGEGRHVRFTGQDTRRGTFSQRHAVLTDFITEDEYIPLNNIKKDQGHLRIYDSPLSEMGVLGYEYGYSIVSPDTLTLWEAQFGDFANNAISIVDQFLACSQVKWGESASLVMLLPHSYDGQGSEHSSARLERYLQLCAQENMIVANLTTPAQYFHILRRQMFMAHKLPLILMTPKSMLRHPLAVSSLEDFTQSEFKLIIDDQIQNKSKIKRILVCTGKIYYELLKEKMDNEIEDVAIIRLEQIYPMDHEQFEHILGSYGNASEFFWVQEEPKNMGAWNFFLTSLLEREYAPMFKYIGRKASASTATGSYKMHQVEQKAIISEAFTK